MTTLDGLSTEALLPHERLAPTPRAPRVARAAPRPLRMALMAALATASCVSARGGRTLVDSIAVASGTHAGEHARAGHAFVDRIAVASWSGCAGGDASAAASARAPAGECELAHDRAVLGGAHAGENARTGRAVSVEMVTQRWASWRDWRVLRARRAADGSWIRDASRGRSVGVRCASPRA